MKKFKNMNNKDICIYTCACAAVASAVVTGIDYIKKNNLSTILADYEMTKDNDEFSFISTACNENVADIKVSLNGINYYIYCNDTTKLSAMVCNCNEKSLKEAMNVCNVKCSKRIKARLMLHIYKSF